MSSIQWESLAGWRTRHNPSCGVQHAEAPTAGLEPRRDGPVGKLRTMDGGPYLGFPRSHDVWGDGAVVIVPAPGHTPDSVVVFVNLPSGSRYAMIGDLTFQLDGLEIPAEKPWMLRHLIGENNEEVHEDIALIRTITEKYPQVHPIPAHDVSAFRSISVFPASPR